MQFFLPKETELLDVHHPEVWSINLENAKKKNIWTRSGKINHCSSALKLTINPLILSSDLHLISPYNITPESHI